MRRIDDKVEVYVFGSVAEGRYVFSSSLAKPLPRCSKPCERGIGGPFEIHVIDREKFETYMKRSQIYITQRISR